MFRNQILFSNIIGFIKPRNFIKTSTKLTEPKHPRLLGPSRYQCSSRKNSGTTISVEEAVPHDLRQKAANVKPAPFSSEHVLILPVDNSHDAKKDIPLTTDKHQCNKQRTQPGGSSTDPPDNGFFRNLVTALSVLLSGGAIYWAWKSDMFSAPTSKEARKEAYKRRRKEPVIKTPKTSKEIPEHVPYLLIGGGTASFSAFRAIKSIDPKAKVLVISKEPFNPYMRPPLSKEMWYSDDRKSAQKLEFKQWNGTERSLFYEPNEFYMSCLNLKDNENGGVSIAQGWNVKSIDVTNRQAVLDDGKAVNYDKCLIATGASPRNLKIFENAPAEVGEKVMLYRGIFDFLQLEQEIEKGAKSIAIIGGGFLGSELACALARRGKKCGLTVTQIFKESGNMGKILPSYLSQWTTKKVEAEGVQLASSAQVIDYNTELNGVKLILDNKREIAADLVIVAIGVDPNVELASSSGLEIDPVTRGFLVNAELEARSNLYAAGDCACFYDVKLGRRRVEHHDHAVVSGRLAGENMTGAGKPYWHQSMFWSDLGPDVGYEAIGIVDSSLPTVGVFVKTSTADTSKTLTLNPSPSSSSEKESSSTTKEKNPIFIKAGLETTGLPKGGEEYGKGVIFYLKNDVVVGIVLWNVFNRMSVARQVIKDERKYEDLNEVAKLFNIHG